MDQLRREYTELRVQYSCFLYKNLKKDRFDYKNSILTKRNGVNPSTNAIRRLNQNIILDATLLKIVGDAYAGNTGSYYYDLFLLDFRHVLRLELFDLTIYKKKTQSACQ